MKESNHKKVPIRVLHVLGSVQLGGAESRVMDLYRHMDRSRIQFDFLLHTKETGYFEQEIKELGGRIFNVPRFKLYNYFSYRKAVKDFFREHHEFQIVQGHITSTAAIYLPVAKRAGVPVTIAHARSAGVDKGAKGKLTRFLRRNLSKKADYLFTCSELAGISVFGKKAVAERETVFIPNAIDCQAFDFDEEKRKKIRTELGLDNKYIIGHVGRFHYAKNHEYLLRVFAALCEKAKEQKLETELSLILLGEGGGMKAARELARELGVQDQVHFLGNKGNVYDYYQAMDYFIYPSRYEGLPGTVVEAQTSGLKCLMSDSICREVVVTDLVDTMSIEENPDKWAEHVLDTMNYDRYGRLAEMQQAGFDVVSQAEKMTKFYETGKWE